MKFHNQTNWQTADLLAIAKRVIKQIEQYGFDAECRKRLILTVVPARQQNWCSGYAYIKGKNAKVRIPKKSNELNDHIKRDFAHVIAHECAHIMGHKGEKWMRSHPVWGRKGADKYFAWASEMTIRKKEAARKTKPGIEDKITALDVRIKKWASKVKRAQTFLRKLTQSRKRYEKLLQLAAQKTASQT